MAEQESEWESTKGSGNVWNPTKDSEGDARTEADDDDFITGYYVDKKENVGQNNATMYTIQKDDGEKVDVWGTTALNGEMDKIRMGSYVKIQWLGKKLTKAGEALPEKKRTSLHSFHAWEVFTNKNKKPLEVGNSFQGSSSNSSTAGKTTSTSNKTAVKEEDDLPF